MTWAKEGVIVDLTTQIADDSPMGRPRSVAPVVDTSPDKQESKHSFPQPTVQATRQGNPPDDAQGGTIHTSGWTAQGGTSYNAGKPKGRNTPCTEQGAAKRRDNTHIAGLAIDAFENYSTTSVKLT